MSNDMESMRTFADQLWKYMVPKLDSKFASNVSYFRAEVVSNPGNNKLEVQRPVENGTLTLPCVRAMSGAQAGQQVVALVMGSMSNAIIVGDGKLNVPGGGGDAGIANFQAQPDGSLVITLTNGISFTATPVMDDAPTQGSNLAVKSGGIYNALNGKADNAFSNVQVGSTTIAADSKADTLTLNAGGLVTLTGNATNDSVTISVDPNHTHITVQVLDLVNADSYGPSNLVTFDADVAEVPLKNCVVNIEPAQAGSGEPSPTNVRPISGRTEANVTKCGKNVLELNSETTTRNGVTFTVDKVAGTVTVSGTPTQNTSFQISTLLHTAVGKSYILSGSPSGGSLSSYYISLTPAINGKYVSDATNGGLFTPVEPMLRASIVVNGGTTYSNLVFRPMIRLASDSDASFEPYKSRTVSMDWTSEAGIVYGGTLDVLTGTLTVDMVSVTLTGAERVYPLSNPPFVQENTLCSYIFMPDFRPQINSSIVCSHFPFVPNVWASSVQTNGAGIGVTRSTATLILKVEKSLVGWTSSDSQSIALSKVVAWIQGQYNAGTPVQVVAYANSPITYQLSPQIISTLLGNNNIWADCGTISVDYGAFLSALDKAIEEHSDDDIRHITEAERTAWDGKADLNHNHDNLYYGLAGGIAILSDADLNNATYRVPGNYICTSSSVAKTVKHFPEYDSTTLVNANANSFRLFVGYAVGGSYVAQELRTLINGAVYYRYYNTSSSNWTSWTGVRGTASFLISKLNTATADLRDATLIATSDVTGETGTWYRRTAVKLWNYIKGKADAVYAAISHTHDASDITSGILPAARGGTGNGNGLIQIGQKSGTTLGTKATAEGTQTTASGDYSHAEGNATEATGFCCHTEGSGTVASKAYSHAEGLNTTASGNCAHAEGNTTIASGDSSHAEGSGTVASGAYSHAEGHGTNAAGNAQHAFGQYNVSDTSNVEIAGWGTDDTNRKNIRTLSRTGNEWIAGTLTQASDARLKDVQGSIPDLSSIRAVRFRWKNGDDKEHLGYLAQDVEGIAPYLVGVDSNGYKSLDYIALLTAKVEMLEREIEKLKGDTRN